MSRLSFLATVSWQVPALGTFRLSDSGDSLSWQGLPLMDFQVQSTGEFFCLGKCRLWILVALHNILEAY